MKTRSLAFVLAILGATLATLVPPPARASSHREAPAITETPQVDGTDFYMFRSYEEGRDDFVTLIANYNPLQDAYGGPNYFPLDPDAFYDLHVDNDGDAVEDLTFRFRFANPSPFIAVPVGGSVVPISLSNIGPFGPPFGLGALNVRRSYTVRLIRGGIDEPDRTVDFVTDSGSGSARFLMPFDNVGAKSVPNYDAYAGGLTRGVDIPGCGPGRLFAGQRKESFAVNLGEVFDLVNLNPVGNPAAMRSATEDKNITSLVLEVPIDCLTGAGPVIGGWTTARLPRNRTLSEAPTYSQPDIQSGDFVQVSRLGMPLVNEIVIGLPDKNRFNASRPSDDAQFLDYVTNPWLPEIIQALFGVQAPDNFPRGDLVATFATGIQGLNDLGVGEMQRLNTAVPPTPAAQQSNLGVIGGDNAGFPNGRRPGDDVVDVELRVAMGVLCHAGLGLCGPADAPDGLLPYTDQTYQGPDQFDDVFPYLKAPLAGSPNAYRTFNANLQGGQEELPVASPFSGACGAVLNDAGTELAVSCTHNVAEVIAAHVHLAPAGVNGPIVCSFPDPNSPIQFVCPVDAAFREALERGNAYVNVHSAANPAGEVRGQLR